MADYSEWLEAIAGTEAIEEYIDPTELQQQAVQRRERDAILCLVDCQHAMFGLSPPSIGTGVGTGGSPFRDAAQCVLRLYQDKVITSNRDLVALVLYNAGVPRNIYDFPGVHIIHPFALLDVRSVQELEELAVAGDITSPEYSAFASRVGHGRSSLSDVLWAAHHMFLSLRSGAVAYRRVFVFTCDDAPHRGDRLEVQRCLARVRDLRDSGVALEVFAMGAGDVFRSELFWSTTVLQRNGDAADSVHVGDGGGACAFAEVFDAVRRRVHPQRPCRTCRLALGVSAGGAAVPAMAVSVFNPLMPAAAPRGEWLDGRTHTLVRRRHCATVGATTATVGATTATVGATTATVGATTATVGATTATVGPSTATVGATTATVGATTATVGATTATGGTAHGAAVAGGLLLRFTAGERQRIVATAAAGAPVGFTVVCVKPMSALRHKHAVRRACLLRPSTRDDDNNNDNSDNNASVRLFVLFARALARRGVFAVAQCVARRGGPPRLVALVPSPPGAAAWLPAEGAALYAVPLPYAEDIRELPATATAAACNRNNNGNASDGSGAALPHRRDVALAARVVAALSVPYDVAAVPSPALQRQYRTLERLARRHAAGSGGCGGAQAEVEVEVEVEDFSLPDREGMARYAQIFHEFNTMVLPPGYNADERCPQPKPRAEAGKHPRAQAGETAEGATSKTMSERGGAAGELSVAETIARVEDAFVRNALATLTVVQLKAYLAAVGENTGAARRKDEIIEIVTKSLQGRVKKE